MLLYTSEQEAVALAGAYDALLIDEVYAGAVKRGGETPAAEDAP